MNNRDDLIGILHQEATADRVKNSPLRDVPVVAAKVESAADAILAAGYRRPRVVTTVTELDALPIESAVRSDMGNVYIKDIDLDDPTAIWWVTAGAVSEFPSIAITLPATVLHEPEADQ